MLIFNLGIVGTDEVTLLAKFNLNIHFAAHSSLTSYNFYILYIDLLYRNIINGL